MSSSRRVAALLISAALSACSGAGPDRAGEPKVAPSIRDLRTEDTTGPYVSVAVDNHFHDVHPEDDIRIAADRAFVVKNQGSNTHNVTIVGTDIDEDIEPGEQVRFAPSGEQLGIGPHVLICRIHAAQGMTGEFTIFEDEATQD